jgi:hypothetical protein
MVDSIIFLLSQRRDPWLSVPRLFMVGFMGNLPSGSYLISILVPKRTKYVNPMMFKDLLRNLNFRREQKSDLFCLMW